MAVGMAVLWCRGRVVRGGGCCVARAQEEKKAL